MSLSEAIDAARRLNLGVAGQDLRFMVDRLSVTGKLDSPQRLFPMSQRRPTAPALECMEPSAWRPPAHFLPSKPPSPLLAPPEQPAGPGRRTVYLLDIIKHLESSALLPLRPALLQMSDKLQGVPSLALYAKGKGGDWAMPLHVGPEFFEKLRVRAAADDPLDGDYGAAMRCIAILATDAAELFGYGVETFASPAPVVPLRLVDTCPPTLEHPPTRSELPVTESTWKDARGEWTDAAKAEMKSCRTHGMTDGAIGTKFGTSRATIQRVLGSRTANKAAATTARHRA